MCAPPRRNTVPSFRAPAAGPASRWGPESRRASAREGARTGARGGGEGGEEGRLAPRPAPRRRSHGGAPRLRSEDQQVRGGEPSRAPGMGGWVWRGPRALPRGPGPAARASPGPQGVRQLGGSLCPQSRPPRRSTPTPRLRAPQQKELARRPRRSRSHPSDSTPGAPPAPAAPHPRLHTHTEAAVQSCGLRNMGAPHLPVGSVGAHSLATEEDG